MFLKTLGGGKLLGLLPVAGLETSSNLKNEDTAKSDFFVISLLI